MEKHLSVIIPVLLMVFGAGMCLASLALFIRIIFREK